MRTEWAVVLSREGDVMVTPHEAVQAAADELRDAFRCRERASRSGGVQIGQKKRSGATERADLASAIPLYNGPSRSLTEAQNRQLCALSRDDRIWPQWRSHNREKTNNTPRGSGDEQGKTEIAPSAAYSA